MQQPTTTYAIGRALRHHRWRVLLSGLVVLGLMSFGLTPAQAQQQTGTLTSIGDGQVPLLSSGWATLAAGEQVAYSFDLGTAGETVNVWMNVAPPDSATLEIWAADDYAGLTAGQTGGTPLGTGAPLEGAPGLITFQQPLDTAGSYVVLITAADETPAQYLLNVSSAGLTLPAPPPANVALTLPVALNVREGPSTAFAVITTIPQGTALTVLGRNTLNTWILVQLPDGTQGWVTRTLTDFIGVADLVDAPAVGGIGGAATATGTTAITGTAGVTGTGEITGTEGITGTGDITDTEGTIPGTGSQLDSSSTNAGESLSNNWRVLGAGEMNLFTFQHSGGNLPVHVWMDVQPNNSAMFGIYDEESAQAIMGGQDVTEFSAIGMGTPNPTEPGSLFWRGTFEEAGQFYIIVWNTSQDNAQYSIYAAGPGLARGTDQGAADNGGNNGGD